MRDLVLSWLFVSSCLASAALAAPQTGWWWNTDQSGSGYSLEVQGKNLFIVGFMYDDAGRPTWYFSAGPMNSDNTFQGPVLQFANGQTTSWNATRRCRAGPLPELTARNADRFG